MTYFVSSGTQNQNSNNQFWFFIFVSSVLVKGLTRKSISEVTYFVSNGMQSFSQLSQSLILTNSSSFSSIISTPNYRRVRAM